VIIEGLLTTSAVNGPHVAALGPVVDEQLKHWLLRPFQTSTTYQNLQRDSICIFHVIDDVLPVARAVLGLKPELEFRRHTTGGWLIDDACHWYKLEVTDWDVSQLRAEAKARVIDQGIQRPFWGWNRAKHAVLEAAIMASRLHLLDQEVVRHELARCSEIIEKTAGRREWAAWQLIEAFVRDFKADCRSANELETNHEP
jgi:uncharacterized protein